MRHRAAHHRDAAADGPGQRVDSGITDGRTHLGYLSSREWLEYKVAGRERRDLYYRLDCLDNQEYGYD
jgi:hypothetical protein